MKLLNRSNEVNYLRTEFKEFEFEFFSVDIKEKLFISCIVCWSDSVDSTVSFWKEIQSIISVNHQPESEYARWNIYLVFLNEEKLSIDDKYRIENDKFSARKIILDGLSKLPTIDEAGEMINSELLGYDMKLSNSLNKNDEVSTLIDSSIFSLINNLPLDSTKESKKIRSEVLNELVKVLN
ncbi:hypothetical protein KTI87_09625 [Acinetobacter nosocomialis]|jgi:hypothetical protein|uniref:ABC-three component system middle component 1 n=1 Tax=Acinetobacter nosocomialis TaxID=106654 RepID=UPI0021D352BA|nr:ABC-three component system middle component 1 [Acinetobacter nosocomialis]MCU4552903.1 hypothetical protein [Acinetobacter nosocomialis]